MSRLPNIGGDDNQWGIILNDFLTQAHNADGTLKQLTQAQITNLTSDLAAKANSSSLHAVATSGSYVDLTNKPAIPDSTAIVAAVEADASVAPTGSWNFSQTPTVAGVPLAPGVTQAYVDRGDKYDQPRALYNYKGSNTRRLRAAMGLARIDAGLCRIAFIGDSVTAGHGTTRGTHDPVTRLREQLVSGKFRTGELIHMFSNLVEPRVPITGTWANQGLTSGFLTAQAGATFTYTATGRYFEIVGSNQSAAFSYQIDGGASVPVTTNATATYKVVTIDAGTEAAHTLKVTGGSGPSFWYAVGCRPANGVVVENAGISGAKTSDFLTATLGGGNVMSNASYPRPDVVIIELGANDMNGSVSVATFKTNLTALVDKFLAYNADVILAVTHTPVATNPTTWAAYVTAQYEVADLRDVPLLDLNDRFGWAATGDDFDGLSYDMSTDGGHLTAAANSAKALAWLDTISPTGFGVITETSSVSLSAVEGIKAHDGSAGGGTRPTGYARIRWVGGTTRPTNMAVGDLWEHDV